MILRTKHGRVAHFVSHGLSFGSLIFSGAPIEHLDERMIPRRKEARAGVGEDTHNAAVCHEGKHMAYPGHPDICSVANRLELDRLSTGVPK